MIGRYIQLDTLIKLRMVSLALSGAFAAVCGGFAIKSLVDLAVNKKLLASTIKGASLSASDLVGAASGMTGSSILGVGVSFFALTLVYFEQRGGVSKRLRWFTEFLLGFCCLAMLGSVIATTYICMTRSARASAPGFTPELINTLVKATGKHLEYRTTMGYYTMIFGWPTTFFLFTDFILLILAGLRYRRQDRERAAAGHAGSPDVREKFDEPKEAFGSSSHVERQ